MSIYRTAGSYDPFLQFMGYGLTEFVAIFNQRFFMLWWTTGP